MTPNEFREAVVEMDRLTDQADRIDDSVAIQAGRARAARKSATALAMSLEPTVASMPEGTYLTCFDWVFWLDPTDGFCYAKTTSWQDIPVEPIL